MEIQKRGKFAVTFITNAFTALAKSEKEAFGAPDHPVLVVQHPIGTVKLDEVSRRADAAFDKLVEILNKYLSRMTAIVFEDKKYTFSQLSERVNRLANALLALGINKGDKIATLLPNCLDLLEVYWASAKIGAVVVPMSVTGCVVTVGSSSVVKVTSLPYDVLAALVA